ncbi:MAG: VOC family protein [Candidatus Heimdallarchaeota archaeon]|nr:VOC family protein [Candidatus Heimdallarchaeota archaeon]
MEFHSQISFLYYKNLKQACDFYEKIFNFRKEIDQGWAKIYRTSQGAYLGLVDEKQGYFNWQKNKTVMITFVTAFPEQVDEWFDNLKKFNVKFISTPKNIDELNIRAFLFEDPEGYVIEIQHFLKMTEEKRL